MIERRRFQEIDEAVLQAHIDNGIPEGPTLEYKRESYGNADSDKKEFLKDISAFANSLGGHIIIGISEDAGVPNEIASLADLDVDAELLRLEPASKVVE